jgi:hypothetical protein
LSLIWGDFSKSFCVTHTHTRFSGRNEVWISSKSRQISVYTFLLFLFHPFSKSKRLISFLLTRKKCWDDFIWINVLQQIGRLSLLLFSLLFKQDIFL